MRFTKHTAELLPGDVIRYADMLDTVVRVEWPDTLRYPHQRVATLHYIRNDKRMHCPIGMNAMHVVVSEEEMK